MNSNLVKQIIIGAIAFIVIGVAMGFGPTLLAGFEETRVDTSAATDVESNTPGLSGSANMTTSTLVYDLYPASVAGVTSVASNITGQTLTVASVDVTTSGANTVNVTGVESTTLQTITIVYDYGTVDQYTGLDTVIEFGPVAILLGFIIMVGIVGFMGIRMVGKQ